MSPLAQGNNNPPGWTNEFGFLFDLFKLRILVALIRLLFPGRYLPDNTGCIILVDDLGAGEMPFEAGDDCLEIQRRFRSCTYEGQADPLWPGLLIAEHRQDAANDRLCCATRPYRRLYDRNILAEERPGDHTCRMGSGPATMQR